MRKATGSGLDIYVRIDYNIPHKIISGGKTVPVKDMRDCCFERDGNRFTYRVGAVIIDDGAEHTEWVPIDKISGGKYNGGKIFPEFYCNRLKTFPQYAEHIVTRE